MTGYAKLSRAVLEILDCVVACAPRNDGIGREDEIAEAAVFLASNESRYVCGHTQKRRGMKNAFCGRVAITLDDLKSGGPSLKIIG
jgi:NAD(P)-dependent dehydrogenase (short-subunit alcohol dehydrogenase family)